MSQDKVLDTSRGVPGHVSCPKAHKVCPRTTFKTAHLSWDTRHLLGPPLPGDLRHVSQEQSVSWERAPGGAEQIVCSLHVRGPTCDDMRLTRAPQTGEWRCDCHTVSFVIVLVR